MAIRATIDERQFRDLVSGKVVTLPVSFLPGPDLSRSPLREVHVILSDIGFARMVLAVQDAMDDAKVTPFDDPPPPLAA